jgi:rhodanese-related sulfurtransferase
MEEQKTPPHDHHRQGNACRRQCGCSGDHTAQAASLVETENALIVDVRDGTEIAANGKIKGAVAVSRGLLEFRADLDLPTHLPDFRKNRPAILSCGCGERAALAGKTLVDMGSRTY